MKKLLGLMTGAALLLVMTAPTVCGDEFEWTKGADGDWSESDSWTPSGPPGESDTVRLSAGTGRAITVDGTNKIDTLIYEGSGTWTLPGTPPDTLEIGTLFDFRSTSGNLRNIVTSISGAGGVTVSSGALRLSGDNSYSGPTLLRGGTLGVGSDTAFGTSTLSLGDGVFTPVGANRTLANDITLDGSTQFGSNADSVTRVVTLTGEALLTGDRTISVFAGSKSYGSYSRTPTFTQGIHDGGNSYTLTTSTGYGTLDLAGASSFGQLIVQGSVVN